MRACKVFVHGIYAGMLTETDRQHYSFEYDDAYFSNVDMPPVCLALPKNQKSYVSPYLFPFFSNMLSEGENRIFQARYLKIDENDDFGILLATAQYDTLGSVTVQPVGKEAELWLL